MRQAVNEGRADFVPVHLSDIPRLITTGLQPIDVALVQVSPPDEHGFCSFGVGVDCTKAAAEAARDVVGARQRPHAAHARRLLHPRLAASATPCEVDQPLLELPRPSELSEVSRAIGRHVAELIEDGSTLQMGIGEIPDASCSELKDRRDLGVHTEMFSDGVVELFEAGVINGEAQDAAPGQDRGLVRARDRSAASTSSTTTRSSSSTRPTTSTTPSSSPRTTAWSRSTRRSRSTSPARCAPTRSAARSTPASAARSDFIRGAARSRGGKPIIALPSTAKGGTLSRIVDTLPEGAGVVTTRADVHYVVTEYGIADLHGKSLRERARALIEIAHPDFREDLLRAASRPQNPVNHD